MWDIRKKKHSFTAVCISTKTPIGPLRLSKTLSDWQAPCCLCLKHTKSACDSGHYLGVLLLDPACIALWSTMYDPAYSDPVLSIVRQSLLPCWSLWWYTTRTSHPVLPIVLLYCFTVTYTPDQTVKLYTQNVLEVKNKKNVLEVMWGPLLSCSPKLCLKSSETPL